MEKIGIRRSPEEETDRLKNGSFWAKGKRKVLQKKGGKGTVFFREGSVYFSMVRNSPHPPGSAVLKMRRGGIYPKRK